MKGWSERDIPDLAGKRALVTGAASGIGFETARALACHRAHVLLVDRNQTAGVRAVEDIRALCADARVEFLPLDLASQRDIREFAARPVTGGGVLDLLVNNAGIQPVSTRRTTQDGFELTFGIGHLGHFALTGLLLPLLLAASAPRVVTVSSLVHGKGTFNWNDLQMERGYDAQRAYNQTKLANLLFAQELQRRATAAGTRLMSLAAHPGVARTAIGSNRRSLGRFNARDHFVSVILRFVMPLLGQPAQAGALPTLCAATAPDARAGGFYGPDGFGEMKGAPALAIVRSPGRDAAAAQRLWETSVKLTGVDYQAFSGSIRSEEATPQHC